MAQRQRITEESSVQIPKVRAWRPFTAVKKKSGETAEGAPPYAGLLPWWYVEGSWA